jgi:hypothetical protein
MIIDRRHIPWAAMCIIATGLLTALYLANFHPERLPYPVSLPAFFGEIPRTHGTVGGSPFGITLGVAALGIFIFAALLGVRKKWPLLRIGHVQVWLRAHIWLSIFTLPLVLLHSGFGIGGTMTRLVLILYAMVMVSGFYGLALQQFMPRLMAQRVPGEVVYEQIPHLRGLLVEQALVAKLGLMPGDGKAREKVVNELRAIHQDDIKSFKERHKLTANKWEDLMTSIPGKPAPASPAKAAPSKAPPEPAPAPTAPAATSGPDAPAAPPSGAVPAAPVEEPAPPADPSAETLLEFLDGEVIPYLRAWRGERHRLGRQEAADSLFRLLKLNVSETRRDDVEEMRAWCDDRRQMDLQMRLHHLLHGWLFVHVPLSLLLIFFTIWHACGALLFL